MRCFHTNRDSRQKKNVASTAGDSWEAGQGYINPEAAGPDEVFSF